MVCGLLTLASDETCKNCQDHCLVTCNPVGITLRAGPLRDPPCLHLLGMQAAFKTAFHADRACLSRKSPLHCSAHVGKTSSAPHNILGRTSLTRVYSAEVLTNYTRLLPDLHIPNHFDNSKSRGKPCSRQNSLPLLLPFQCDRTCISSTRQGKHG